MKKTEQKNMKIISDNNLPMNEIIESDNIHALKYFQKDFQNLFDVIYIDPPYNTGATNWRYNNSIPNWKDFMKVRLELAKNLLKEKTGGLIIAIDKSEFLSLGNLLHELFSDFQIHCCPVINNRAGTAGTNFGYQHEYAYFVFPKGKSIINPVPLDKPINGNFQKTNPNHLRINSPKCFYPIIIPNILDKKVGTKVPVLAIGDVPNANYKPPQIFLENNDMISVYPYLDEDVAGRWIFSRDTVDSIKDELYAYRGKEKIIIKRNKPYQQPRSVFMDVKYDANTYGTKILNKLIDTKFDYPKSIYLVKDCLACFIRNKPDALVLDFFAGSGTTGHATMLLNKEDNGRRKFILVTKNENEIAKEVCYERIKSVINGRDNLPDLTGIPGNLKYSTLDG